MQKIRRFTFKKTINKRPSQADSHDKLHAKLQDVFFELYSYNLKMITLMKMVKKISPPELSEDVCNLTDIAADYSDKMYESMNELEDCINAIR